MSNSDDIELVEDYDDTDFFTETNSFSNNDPLLNSSKDEDPYISGKLQIKKFKSDLERERRGHLATLFNYLHQLVYNGLPRGESYKRINVVTRAMQVCQDLKIEENKLLLELEVQLQENWKLKRHLTALSKKKKKPASSILVRRVSSLTLSPSKTYVPEVRRKSMDDAKVTETVSGSLKENTVEKSTTNLRPKRKHKKRAGLSEEEKEFYKLHDKLVDLEYDVDVLWDEVKDDEEIDYENEAEEPVADSKNELVAGLPNVNPTRIPNFKSDCFKFISVTDIKKLMIPKLRNMSDQSTSKTSDNLKFNSPSVDASNDSSDEDRLIIDEDNPKDSVNEPNVMETLQVVDDLCRKIIPDDEPSLSIREEQGKNENNAPVKRRLARHAAPRDLTDIIIIDD